MFMFEISQKYYAHPRSSSICKLALAIETVIRRMCESCRKAARKIYFFETSNAFLFSLIYQLVYIYSN